MTAESAGRRIAIASMGISAALAAAKIIIGLQANSTATVSDGYRIRRVMCSPPGWCCSA